MDSRKLLIALAVHFQGDWHKMYEALIKHEYPSEEVIEGYLLCVKSKVITILDVEYPSYLRKSPYPPFVLFYYGDLSLISNVEKNVAVVGGRKVSETGKENVKFIVSGLAKEYNIVSGLALGIDTVAHKTALLSGGKTIAILANGIEYCYPSENNELYEIIKKNNLVLSEYFGYISPEADHFHQRNRLIVALSRGTIIGESTLKSGTSITASITHRNNKDLFAIPSSDIHNSLCNTLISEGAPAILSSQDVVDYFNFGKKYLLGDIK